LTFISKKETFLIEFLIKTCNQNEFFLKINTGNFKKFLKNFIDESYLNIK
jgi:hypothetical protein